MDENRLTETENQSLEICKKYEYLKGKEVAYTFNSNETSKIIDLKPIKIYEDHYNLNNPQQIFCPAVNLKNGITQLLVSIRVYNAELFK